MRPRLKERKKSNCGQWGLNPRVVQQRVLNPLSGRILTRFGVMKPKHKRRVHVHFFINSCLCLVRLMQKLSSIMC